MSTVPFDPRILPLDSVAGEAAVAAERLTPQWLRRRFAEPPDWQPEVADESRALGLQPTRASVLVLLVQRAAGLTILFTERTAHLSSHAGQISFPGGRHELSDTSPIETALRETEEEVGLERRHIDVLGTLPDYHTITGYCVTPVVGLVTPPFELRADPAEVAEIFEVPLAFLMDGMNHQCLSAVRPEGRRRFYAMPYERCYIWGATAGMLRNLFHFLRA